MTDLKSRLCELGFIALAEQLEDVVARAQKHRWSFLQAIEHVADFEERERARRGLERRTRRSKLERFKPMADFDWNWPTDVDRPTVEAALSLEFLPSRNVVLVAPQGLGKTMIAKNVAHQAILAGHTVLFITAADLLLDLGNRRALALSSAAFATTPASPSW